MNRTEVIEFLREHKNELFRKYGVQKIGLFGSYSRNEMTESSDIDIAVELDEKYKTLHNFRSLEEYLESSLKKKIDLGVESSFKPLLLEQIRDEIIYV